MPKTIKKKSNISITLDNELLRLIKKRRIYLSRLVNELLWKQLATSQIPYSQFPLPQGSVVERCLGNVEVAGSNPLMCCRSSVVERLLGRQEVAGSTPADSFVYWLNTATISGLQVLILLYGFSLSDDVK